MSYQVIARRWRSKTFDELIGQSHVTQTLRNALKSGRLPHAILFTGPRGVGKTSAARILAKSLKCPNAKEYVPCNECTVCEEVNNGSSIDVMEIDGASNNGVEAVRELIENVGYMPANGKYKVYVIDEVHMLSTSAFNALLKTLEEPPAHVKFIFATTEVQKIPNTILSRCQRFDFRRIPTREIASHLKKIATHESVEAADEALWTIARHADGSMRDSQSLLDQVITFSQNKITIEKVTEVLGLTDRALIIDTLNAIVTRDSTKALDVVARIYTAGYDPKTFANDLLEEIRHLLLVKECGEKASQFVDLPENEINELSKLSQELSKEDVHLLFDMALKGGADIPKSHDPRLVLEMVILRMTNAPMIADITQFLGATPQAAASPTPVKKKSPPKKQAPVGAASTKTEAPAQKPTPQTTTETPSQKTWPQFIDFVKIENPLLGAKLENTSFLSKENQTLNIGVRKTQEFMIPQLDTDNAKKDLETKAKGFWNSDLKFKFEVLKDNSKQAPLSPREAKIELAKKHEQEIREKVEANPTIQKAKKLFNSEIESIRGSQS